MPPDAATSAQAPAPRVAAACDYCGSADTTSITGQMRDEEGLDHLPPAFREQYFNYARCKGCGLVYLKDRPALADLGTYYPADYKCFQDYASRGALMYWLARRTARGKLKQIRRLVPAGSNVLLDYGCGSGTWLRLLRAIGADMPMIGTDVVDHPLEQLRKEGISAYCADERTLKDHVKPGSVGVIHLFHVIEHIPSPLDALKALRDTLAPGGAILGQTPNVESFGRKFWGDHWAQWHPPQHLVLFSPQSLRRHAEKAGLEVVKISNSLSSATQWAASATHWWARARGRLYRGIHEPLYAPLILWFLPWTVMQMPFVGTCHMDFVLRRPSD